MRRAGVLKKGKKFTKVSFGRILLFKYDRFGETGLASGRQGPCGVAVLGCEFPHRPGAGPSVAAGRRQNSQARTPAPRRLPLSQASSPRRAQKVRCARFILRGAHGCFKE